MNRIAALDMLRGYALVCIMLDHMPIGVLRNVTLSNFAVFDAAELFVLLSGFLVGMVWVNTWLTRDLRTPFGGVGASGLGREGGAEAMRFFTEPKNVCLALRP